MSQGGRGAGEYNIGSDDSRRFRRGSFGLTLVSHVHSRIEHSQSGNILFMEYHGEETRVHKYQMSRI